ncbi:MAG: hypothetical protein ASARMPRED_008738 [Alectoria sarmentosa]|nr:MAG: hypothetical protein ASARMPRED_008738 [Alectoria sarmentosa]
MPRRTEEETSAAGAEALRGAVWGLIAGGLGAIYRGLTVQFKVYIQLSGMTFGGWIEADRRLRAYEFHARREKKRQNDEAVWRRWEGMIEQQERREQEQKQEKG